MLTTAILCYCVIFWCWTHCVSEELGRKQSLCVPLLPQFKCIASSNILSIVSLMTNSKVHYAGLLVTISKHAHQSKVKVKSNSRFTLACHFASLYLWLIGVVSLGCLQLAQSIFNTHLFYASECNCTSSLTNSVFQMTGKHRRGENWIQGQWGLMSKPNAWISFSKTSTIKWICISINTKWFVSQMCRGDFNFFQLCHYCHDKKCPFGSFQMN